MTDPFSMLVYPVGIAVSQVVGKVIDCWWTQPQSSTLRQKEYLSQHKLREQEQIKQHRFRLEELSEQYELRGEEQTQQHHFRLKELNEQYNLRIKELTFQYEQSIAKSFIDSGIRIQEHKIIERLRASYSVAANKALRDAVREETNSPFFDGVETTCQNLIELHKNTGLPIILMSPFWDDSRTKPAVEQGGYVDFRNAFSLAYRQSPWSNLACKQDGYFKRPLYQTDRDVNYIYSVLSDVPTILVHGTIQGVHSSHQNIQRIHPQVTFWNLLPGQEDEYTSIDLRFFPLSIPTEQGSAAEIYQSAGKYSLCLQDEVGIYLSKAIGLLSAFHHLHRFGDRPALHQFPIENEEELKVLSLRVEEFYDQYNVLCQLTIDGTIKRDSKGDTLI